MPNRKRVLVLDDDLAMRQILCDFINDSGFKCIAVETAAQALQALQEQQFSVMITDLRLGKANGLDVLRESKKLAPDVPVIMITAFGSIENAIEAMKEGAYHYITKPFKIDEITLILNKAIESAKLKRENAELRQVIGSTFQFENIIGRSRAMQNLFDMVERLEANTSNVLITGESGTGKELFAKAIHFNSPLRDGSFVAVNCAAIPEGLLESELFGHVKGAFTGAALAQTGLLESADGGSLFLDEIGDMPLVLQSKLLRVLQDQLVRPLGSREERKINVRIIAATHKDLEKAVSVGEFREDLFYRLNVLPIKIPRLADRLEDIPLLAKHFLNKHAKKTGKEIKDISADAIDALMAHAWPGNVRELENVIERAMAFAVSDILRCEDLSFAFREPHEDVIKTHNSPLTLQELECRYIQRVLQETDGHKDQAAKILGINRRTLYRKSERLGIDLNVGSKKSAT